MAIIRTPHRTGRVAIPIFFLLLLACLSLPSSATKCQEDDDEVLRVNTDLVVLNVTVVDSEGKFIHGLDRKDFKLFVDGQERKMSSFMPEETPFAAAVLLDTSASMEQRLMLARSAAIRFLQELRQDDTAAVYRFDSEIEKIQDYSTSRDLGEFAFSIRAKGMTSLNDAILRASIDLGQRPEDRRAIIVLSDGADTKSSASANKALETALASNATIYAVDMSSLERVGGRNLSAAAALQNFAAKTGGRYVSSAGGPVMREAFTQIAEELSNQYTVAYLPPPSARDGHWHKLEIKLSRPDLVARARKGYHAPKG
jgi:Ca-activated chloride channel family protein